MPADLNRVTLVGRLTRDPELRHTQGGDPVCSIRLAVSSRARAMRAGNWGDRSNYFDVTVFGRQAETASTYLAKGRRIGVDGRLSWREWQAQDGSKRQSVEVIANDVFFLDSRGEGGGGGGGAQQGAGGRRRGETPPRPPAAGRRGGRQRRAATRPTTTRRCPSRASEREARGLPGVARVLEPVEQGEQADRLPSPEAAPSGDLPQDAGRGEAVDRLPGRFPGSAGELRGVTPGRGSAAPGGAR